MPDARPAKRAGACVQAASLLGESGEEGLAGTPADEAAFFDRTRPAQLGLGAKYVVHRHAVTGAASCCCPAMEAAASALHWWATANQSVAALLHWLLVLLSQCQESMSLQKATRTQRHVQQIATREECWYSLRCAERTFDVAHVSRLAAKWVLSEGLRRGCPKSTQIWGRNHGTDLRLLSQLIIRLQC